MALLSMAKRRELEELVTRVAHCRLETHPRFFDAFVEGCQFAPRSGAGRAAAREERSSEGGQPDPAHDPHPRHLARRGRGGGGVHPPARVSARPRARGPRRGAGALWARAWYAAHGRPWVFVRVTEALEAGERSFAIEGEPFTPSRLCGLLRQSQAHAVALAAVSAGADLEAEAARLWALERPDEYYFLEVFGSAVVEHLAMRTGARLCAWAEAQGMAVMPHDSPGYPGWDIGEQPRLLELVARRGEDAGGLPGPLRALESGALVPKKSLLAVYGLTRQADARGRLSSLVPCDHCSLPRCEYRRRPYRPAGGAADDASRADAAPRGPAPG